ncbi:MAG: DUF2975 domain-containing protein [Solidesulfovibrio sp.]|uniref:DUF2975 domain-containing protein n=1 Tax=Solidesulfovibrio sp. TaxID=2910990 RepID=UPI003158F4CF
MNTGNNLNGIKKLGGVLERVCLIAAVAVVPLTALYWAAFNALPPDMTASAVTQAVSPVLPAWVRLLCFLASMVPAVAFLVTLLRLRHLFVLYREGRIFTLANVACFRRLAKALLLWAVATILYTPLSGLAVTAANPPGRHILALGLGTSELALFFVVAVAVVIARVMDEARRLDEEQALTV